MLLVLTHCYRDPSITAVPVAVGIENIIYNGAVVHISVSSMFL